MTKTYHITQHRVFVPDTDFWKDRLAADPSLWESRVKPIPAGRPGTPDEVAEAVNPRIGAPG